MEKTSKQPPVDRGKLLIALECCRAIGKCKACPCYWESDCFSAAAIDALAYICYLEEQLEEALHE